MSARLLFGTEGSFGANTACGQFSLFSLPPPVRRTIRPPLRQHRFVMRAPRVTNHAYQGKPRARMKSAIASPRISCMGRRS